MEKSPLFFLTCSENSCHLQPMPFKNLCHFQPAQVPWRIMVRLMNHSVDWMEHRRKEKIDRRSHLFSLSLGTARKLWVGGWGYKKCSAKERSSVSAVLRSQREDTIGGPAYHAQQGLCNAPFLGFPSSPASADEGSKGAHGVSQSWSERRAAGVCVSAGAGVKRPSPRRVRSPLGS